MLCTQTNTTAVCSAKKISEMKKKSQRKILPQKNNNKFDKNIFAQTPRIKMSSVCSLLFPPRKRATPKPKCRSFANIKAQF